MIECHLVHTLIHNHTNTHAHSQMIRKPPQQQIQPASLFVDFFFSVLFLQLKSKCEIKTTVFSLSPTKIVAVIFGCLSLRSQTNRPINMHKIPHLNVQMFVRAPNQYSILNVDRFWICVSFCFPLIIVTNMLTISRSNFDCHWRVGHFPLISRILNSKL